MRLLITGATGLIGRRLVLDRLERGDQVVIVSRDGARAARLFAAGANPNITIAGGDPARPGPWQDAASGCDAAINLAGAGLADRRWSPEFKRLLLDSRVESTRQVVAAIERAASRPRALLNASAVGWYGDCGDRAVDEWAPAGQGFLARLCEAWEAQAATATALGVRMVTLRTGVVLDSRGGMLAKALLPFRMYIGGPIGHGRAFLPWVHWRDVVGLIDLALKDDGLRGPLNLTSPNPVTSRTFARALGSVLHRPAVVPVPALALRVALGELARYATMSQRILPAKATERGYRFLYPDVEPALRSLLREAGGDGQPAGAGERAADGNPPVRDRRPVSATGSSPAAPAPGARNPGAANPVAGVAATRGGAGIEAGGGARPREAVRLLAVDVDGTLLRNDQRIARGVIRACRAAERAGCVVVLATARPPRTTRPIVQALGIAAPTINYNGALIWNPLDHRPLFHQPLPPETTRAVVALARRLAPEVLVGLEILDEWYTDRIDPRFEIETLRRVQPDYIGPLEEFLSREVTKLNLLGPPRCLEAIRRPIEERFWKSRQVAIFPGDQHLMQITHPLADKAMALQRIAARLGVTREAVMAIGEGINDAGMVEWAGFGVAVEHACAPVRALARAVVPSPDGLGVARAIQRYVLAGAPHGAR